MARIDGTSHTRAHAPVRTAHPTAQGQFNPITNGNGIGVGQPSLHLHMLGVPRRVAGSWW